MRRSVLLKFRSILASRYLVKVAIAGGTWAACASATVAQPGDRPGQGDSTAPPYTTLDLGNGPSGSYVFDEESGVLGAWSNRSDRKEGAVRLFRPEFFDGQGASVVGPIVIPKGISTAVLARQKGRLVLVVANGEGEILLIDPDIPGALAVIVPQEQGGTALYRMQSDGKVLISDHLDRGTFTRVLDLNTGEVGPRIPGERTNPCAVARDLGSMVRVSRDQLVLSARGIGGPDRWRDIASVNKIGDYLSSPARPRPVVGPFGRFVAIGTAVRETGVGLRKVAETPFVVLAASNERPLLVGMRGTMLEAASSNTFESTGSVDFAGWLGRLDERVVRRMARTSPPHTALPRMFIDGPRDRVIAIGLRMPTEAEHAEDTNELTRLQAAGKGARVWYLEEDIECRGIAIIVPLSRLGPREEPFVGRYIEGAHGVQVGHELELTLAPHEKGSPGTVKLMSGPHGMRLVGDSLRWTPRMEDIGKHEVTIRTEVQGTSVDQSVFVCAEAVNGTVSFSIGGMEISPTGDRAVVWEGERVKMPGETTEPPPGRLAVFDTRTGIVVTEAEVDRQIHAAAIGDGLVFVALSRDPAVVALSRDDLKEVRRRVLDEPARSLRIASDLVVVEAGPVVVLRAADLSPVNEGPGEFAAAIHRDPLTPRRVPEGWAWGECVFGPTLRKPVLVTLGDKDDEATDLWRIGPRAEGEWEPQPWGREVDRNGWLFRPEAVHTAPRNPVLSLYEDGGGPWDDGFALMLDAPAAVRFMASRDSHERDGVRITIEKAWLAVFGLADGAAVRVPLSTRASASGRISADVRVSPVMVAATDRDERTVYFIPRTDVRTDGLAPPLAFKLEQSVIVAPAGRTTALAHTVVGGQWPMQFELLTPAPWLSLNEETGLVRLDGTKLLATAPEQFMEYMNAGVMDTSRLPADVAKSGLAAYRKMATPRFKRACGVEPHGVPFAVPIELSVKDRNDETAQIRYVVLVDLPEGPIAKKIRAMRDP